MNIFQKIRSKVSIKIWSGFILILLIMAAIVGYNYMGLDEINDKVVNLEEIRVQNLLATEALALETARQAAAIRGYAASGKEEFINDYYDATSQVDKNISFLDGNARFKDRLAVVVEAVDNFRPHPLKVIDIYAEQGPEEAVEYLTVVSAPDYEKVISEINNYIDYQEGAIHDDIYDIQDVGSNSNKMSLTLLAVALILGIIIAAFISRIISRPLVNLTRAANKVASGNLDVEISVDSRDEIGALAQAFARMTANTNEALSNINSAAEQVAAGSKQVSDSSMALSQGATEQASSIEELTASLEEISSQTELNAENANQANELAVNVENDAQRGNTQMKEMLNAMQEINTSSANISKIIKVIDEIAFQTNILALNAAVEAARAGQHGKGFAVVAEEVRNLAARSANAAKETTDMIESSIQKVEDGTEIANETAGALNEIVELISKAAAIINDIAIASNEQATAIGQINQGIMQVSQVVQTNSATSEEGAAASEELSSQAELLKNAVGKFRLKEIRGNAGSFNVERGLDADTIRLIEDMVERKKQHAYDDYDGGGEIEPAASNHKKEIILDDKEFGKY